MRDDRLQPVEMADEHLDAYGYQDEAAQELGLDAPRDGRTETDAEQIADDREKRGDESDDGQRLCQVAALSRRLCLT